ncbi:MAG: tRNA 2-thiouridine(34) synthase MnmA [Eubacteriales bacterium]|nr:tRNA 2-thiouridine(34) synthase MnmA [Eubacteriales bacterium]
MAKKAIVAMSGGVDSSVALYLVKEAGYEAMGVTLKLYENETVGIKDKTCCSLADMEDARSVAYKMGVPYRVFNFSDDFEQEVIDRFVAAYEKGWTPNPCIDCNRYIKFKKLYERARDIGYDYVATGHYARVEYDEASGRYLLKKATDNHKDQTYVLYSLTQDQLAHTLFPLGGMVKDETREIAEDQGFINARKRDSQDICFVPDGDYAGFIENFTGKEYPEGDFVDQDGNVLGRHKGIIGYTTGQRKGLGLALPHPMYVKEKDVEHNRVVLAPNEELFTTELKVSDFNWIAFEKPDAPFRGEVKVRYSQKAAPATITAGDDGTVSIVFDEPERAVTKGQAAVVYQGDNVVGGGTITEV